MSSKIHVIWAGNSGATLEDRPRYIISRCFDPFPFPDPEDEALKDSIRAAAEELDATRKTVLEEHPDLTMTGLYNILEKVKAGAPLDIAEMDMRDRGRVLILKELHEKIDALVFDAYGWPQDLSDEEILGRLVDLNQERAEEERQGRVRWLRPEYQIPKFGAPHEQKQQMEADFGETEETAKNRPSRKTPWVLGVSLNLQERLTYSLFFREQ